MLEGISIELCVVVEIVRVGEEITIGAEYIVTTNVRTR